MKAEFSNSVNGSLTFTPASLKNNGFKTTLSGFYTAYRNQVELLQSFSNTTEYTYYNTDKSKTTGGSLENVWHRKKLEVGLGVSYIGYSSSQFADENYLKEDSREFLWTPEINANLAYRLDKIKTTFGLFYKYTGSKPTFSFGMIDNQNAILLTKTSAYQLADFTVKTDINKFLTAHVGIKNIFDVTTVENNTVSSSNSSHSSVGPLSVGYGRSFFAGLSFSWNKK